MTSAHNCPQAAGATARLRRSLPTGPSCQLRVYNVRLPFRTQIIARRGQHLLDGERFRGSLAEGKSVFVEPYRTVHYEGATSIDPRVGYELHLILYDDCTDAADDGQGRASPSLFAARIAREVLREPTNDWPVALTAERLGLSARQLQVRLFRENTSLTDIIREQRLMHALLALLAQPRARVDLPSLAARVGFATASRLDHAFEAHFGSTASQIATLAWYPALTWSIADDLARAAIRTN